MSQRCPDDSVIVQYGRLMASAIACDCSGQFVVLCSPKLFALINLEKPKEIVRTVSRSSRSKFCAAQWNPSSFYSSLFLSVSSQCVELWSWDSSGLSASHKTTLKGHTRTVNDFDWSYVDPNIAATCSADTNTCLWDIRESRRPTTTLQSVVCPSQVRWNRLRERSLATTHEGDLKIWDLRRCNTPVNYITAHENKVTGLDWSPLSDRLVATCSEDSSVKFWDITSQKQEANKIQSNTPFWKVKYMPFGNGVATSYMPQTGGTLCFWTLNKLLSHQHRQQPICTFGSHGGRGIVIDFCWRPTDSDHQLLSWSDDDSLRICKIDPLIKQRCGNGLFSSFTMSNSCESTPDREIMELDANETIPTGSDMMPANARRRKRGNYQAPAFPPDGLSVENARTLKQEFTLLNVTIPDVTITEMSPESQTLTVNVVKGVHKVCLTMSFPSSYPNRVSPEFRLSDDTTLDRLYQQKLVEDLQSTALQHVQQNRRCIEPCLWKLVTSLDSIIQESQTSPDLDAVYLPMQEIWSPFSTEKLRDENVPFPRISGARFCGPGLLVCFTRRMFLDVPLTNIVSAEPQKRKQSESGITPRAMSALSEMAQPTRIPAGTGMMRGYMGAAQSLPSDSSVPSVSQYYQLQDQKPRKSKNKPRNKKQEPSHSVTVNKKSPVGPVIVYDLSCLLPVQKSLGENYVFDARDPALMCRRNAQVAATAGRKDLVQVWSLAAVQVAYSRNSGVFGDFSTPWGLHPFGQKLIKLWLDYYISVHDVQTLAMLCCAFGSTSPSKSLTPPPPLTSSPLACKPLPPSSNIPTVSNYNTYHTIHSTDSSLKGWSYTVRKMRRSNSWSEVKFEGMEETSDKNTTDGETPLDYSEESVLKSSNLLDSKLNVQYDLFITAYSNILFQWGQMNQRAELLNFLSAQPRDQNANFCVEPVSLEVKDNYLGGISLSIVCVLCRMKVKGLVSVCMVCGHGGHTVHMAQWFLSHSFCASGCGCECICENPPDFMAS